MKFSLLDVMEDVNFELQGHRRVPRMPRRIRLYRPSGVVPSIRIELEFRDNETDRRWEVSVLRNKQRVVVSLPLRSALDPASSHREDFALRVRKIFAEAMFADPSIRSS